MLHLKRPNRTGIIHPSLGLLRIKPHALPDDRLGRTGRAPDGEGHLEADRWGTGGDSLAAGGFVEGAAWLRGERFIKGGGRVVPAHVEALHDGGLALCAVEGGWCGYELGFVKDGECDVGG